MPIKVSNGKETYDVDESRISEAQKDGFVPVIKVSNGKQEFDVHPTNLAKAQRDGFKPVEPIKPEESNPFGAFGEAIKTIDDYTGIPTAVVKAGRFVDSYTGAPTRSAISSMQDGNNPFSAFKNQFGENPDLAPTGKQITQKAGVPDTSLSDKFPSLFTDDPEKAKEWLTFQKGGPADISASGAAGLGVDLLADPTLVVPVNKVARLVGKTAELGAKGTIKAAELTKNAASAAEKAVLGTKAIDSTTNFIKGSAQVASEAAQNTKNALSKLVNPSIANDYETLVSTAKKHGIDPEILPEAIKYGENSFISRATRHKAEGPVGEAVLNKFKEGYAAVQGAIEKTISKIGGGKVPDAIEAGEVIRSGFDKGVDNFFSNTGMTHNKVAEAIPGLKIDPESFSQIESKLDGIEKWAKGRAQRGFTATQRSQAEQVLKAIDAVRESKVPTTTLQNVIIDGKKYSNRVTENLYSYKRLSEALRDIGEVAFKSKNVLADIPPDIEKFRDLYFTINEGLINTAGKAAGAPVAESLRETNKAIHEFLGDKSVISHVVGNKNIAPEKVFQSLVLNGDTKKLQSLKKILPADDFNRLKSAFLNDLIKKNADDAFSFKALHNSLRDRKNIVGELFTPEEINEVSDLIGLGSRFGNPILSHSGTGASNVFSDIAKGVRNAIENDTIVEWMKRRADGKAFDGARDVSESAIDATSRSATKTPLISNPKVQKLAAASPAAVKLTSSQSNKSGQNEQSSKTVLKGESKWAKDGYTKLLEHDKSGMLSDPKLAESLFSTNDGVRLLIQASDLKPGTKAMDKIIEKIKSRQKGAK